MKRNLVKIETKERKKMDWGGMGWIDGEGLNCPKLQDLSIFSWVDDDNNDVILGMTHKSAHTGT